MNDHCRRRQPSRQERRLGTRLSAVFRVLPNETPSAPEAIAKTAPDAAFVCPSLARPLRQGGAATSPTSYFLLPTSYFPCRGFGGAAPRPLQKK